MLIFCNAMNSKAPVNYLIICFPLRQILQHSGLVSNYSTICRNGATAVVGILLDVPKLLMLQLQRSLHGLTYRI